MNNRRTQLVAAINQFYAQPIARVSIELILSVLAVAFFAVFAIRPTLLTMSDLIKEIEDKRKLDAALAQKIASLSTAQSSYLALEERLFVLDKALPSTPRVVEALKIIEKSASDLKVPITNISVNELPDEPPSPPPFETSKRLAVTALVSVTGDYQTIRQFIESLRNSQRTLVIETVTFSLSEESGKKNLKATLTISIPYFGVES